MKGLPDFAYWGHWAGCGLGSCRTQYGVPSSAPCTDQSQTASHDPGNIKHIIKTSAHSWIKKNIILQSNSRFKCWKPSLTCHHMAHYGHHKVCSMYGRVKGHWHCHCGVPLPGGYLHGLQRNLGGWCMSSGIQMSSFILVCSKTSAANISRWSEPNPTNLHFSEQHGNLGNIYVRAAKRMCSYVTQTFECGLNDRISNASSMCRGAFTPILRAAHFGW